ncbi:hypothetical protein GCM10010840_11480 [Deinococcus aerolatus]|uniref:Uncharacterized protein n=1 Tax=Deinococcus aerolatus TaxID=522487 RepID=A0ABQ2G4I1_9DEIO|nr:glycosyltransferase [Deinococcus aerolatus]GGL75095.1 hypothetical protein GCM10010840_11480 [Deinococcus aerolatus]
MELVTVLEHRFERTPDGQIWTQTAFAYSDWLPYLTTFESVNVVARVEDIAAVGHDMKLSSGPNVCFTAVPYFVGPKQFLLKARIVRRAVHNALLKESAVLLRIPGILGAIAYSILKKTGRPYGVLVAGDPHEVFARGAVRHPLRPLFQWWFTREMQIQCQNAMAISYVTRSALQKRYPSRAGFSTSFSDVKLSEDTFVDRPHTGWQGLATAQRPCRMALVGSLEQMYKAPDVVIKALAICANYDLHLQLTIIGEGKHRPELEALTRELNVQDRVRFAGQLSSGEAVRHELDQADLFVLPSRTEGLPRAMIEAMARGLPCIGSTVGGIPELLPSEDLVPPGDVHALAQKLQEVVTSPTRLGAMSSRNLEAAHTYEDSAMTQQRTAFYQYIEEQTARWQAARHRVVPPSGTDL